MQQGIRMDDFPKTSFSNVLIQLRKNAGMTQQKLAEACELDRTYISMLERGLRMPTLQTIFDLSCALGIRASDIVELVVLDLNANGQ